MSDNPQHPKLVWGAVILLALLHHDFWWWNSRTLVLGFLPIGLAYHAAFSIAAGLLWAAACRWAWPTHIEEWADQVDSASLQNSSPATPISKS
ncbi:MAG: hypothetical protein ACO34E_16220 [Limisphaerales bacterium]